MYGLSATSRVLTALVLPDGRRWSMTYRTDRIRVTQTEWQTITTFQLARLVLPSGAVLEWSYTTPPHPGYDFTTEAAWDRIEFFQERLNPRIGGLTVDLLDGSPRTTTWSYSRDEQNRILSTTETRPDGSGVVTAWNPPGTTDAALRQRQDTCDVNGTTLLQREETVWTQAGGGKRLAEVKTAGYTAWGSGQGTARRVTVYDSLGRWKEEHLYSGTSTPLASRYRTLSFNSTRYLLLVTREDQTRWRDSLTEYVVSSLRYGYDETPLVARDGVVQHDPSFGTATTLRGNVTTIRQLLHPENRFLTTTMTYDMVGNRLTTTDPLGRTTTVTYTAETAWAYPVAATNAAGHTVHTVWDVGLGRPTAVTGANGQTTTLAYDEWGRTVREDRPDGGWTTRNYDDAWNQGEYRQRVVTTRAIDAAAAVTTWELLDGLGRLVRTEVEQATGDPVRVDREYAACAAGSRCPTGRGRRCRGWRRGTMDWDG